MSAWAQARDAYTLESGATQVRGNTPGDGFALACVGERRLVVPGLWRWDMWRRTPNSRGRLRNHIARLRHHFLRLSGVEAARLPGHDRARGDAAYDDGVVSVKTSYASEMLILAAISVTLGGTYTIDDLALAAQRGMPLASLEMIAGSIGDLTSEDVVKLLRSGVPVALISEMTGGNHPTPLETEAASIAGRLSSAPPPREYRGLTDRAWLMLLGHEIVLATGSGPVMGTLTEYDDAVLTLVHDGVELAVEMIDVRSVRRADGLPIAMVTVRDVEEASSDALDLPAEPVRGPSSTHGRRTTGAGLIAGGAASLAWGAVCMVAFRAEATAADDAASRGDPAAAGTHASASALWSTFGYVSLSAGTPILVGGIIVLSLSPRGNAGPRSPSLEDFPEAGE